MIELIVCCDKRGGIGHGAKLPWHCPRDLRWFREKTQKKVLLFGRRTWENIPLKADDDDRTFFVLTNCPEKYGKEERRGAYYSAVPEGMKKFLERLERDYGTVSVCGGKSLYEQLAPLANRVFLTTLGFTSRANVFWRPPCVDENWAVSPGWEVVEEHQGEYGGVPYAFFELWKCH